MAVRDVRDSWGQSLLQYAAGLVIDSEIHSEMQLCTWIATVVEIRKPCHVACYNIVYCLLAPGMVIWM